MPRVSHMYVAVIVMLLLSGLPLSAGGEVTVVDTVDLERYVGRWFEIARYPNRFQKKCTASEARYEFREDGDIKVTNICYDNEGRIKSDVEGKAWVADPGESTAKLKVRFFWPFSAPYWIIDLDREEYQWAVVGHPEQKYLWILAREQTLAEEVLQGILDRLPQQGYDPDKLIWDQWDLIDIE